MLKFMVYKGVTWQLKAATSLFICFSTKFTKNSLEIKTNSRKVSYINSKYDDSNYDIGFNANARNNNVFLYMVNLKQHGHLKVCFYFQLKVFQG